MLVICSFGYPTSFEIHCSRIGPIVAAFSGGAEMENAAAYIQPACTTQRNGLKLQNVIDTIKYNNTSLTYKAMAILQHKLVTPFNKNHFQQGLCQR